MLNRFVHFLVFFESNVGALPKNSKQLHSSGIQGRTRNNLNSKLRTDVMKSFSGFHLVFYWKVFRFDNGGVCTLFYEIAPTDSCVSCDREKWKEMLLRLNKPPKREVRGKRWKRGKKRGRGTRADKKRKEKDMRGS